MMTHRIAALLDRPSPKSFGMVPFVERLPEGALVVHGLKGRPARPLVPADLDQLLQERSALSVDATITEPVTATTVAGWVGRQFQQEAGGIPPSIPWDRLHAADDQGHFWLANRETVYRAMEQWVHETARDVFEYDDARRAKLMIWVLPDSEVTRAAVWSTKKTEEERRERIAWWLRLERDAGRPTSEAELTERLKRVREEYLSANTKRLAGYAPVNVPRRSTRAAPLFRKAAHAPGHVLQL